MYWSSPCAPPCCTLQALVRLRRQYGFLLAVDEAHATLVCGERGGGAAEAMGVAEQVSEREEGSCEWWWGGGGGRGHGHGGAGERGRGHAYAKERMKEKCACHCAWQNEQEGGAPLHLPLCLLVCGPHP